MDENDIKTMNIEHDDVRIHVVQEEHEKRNEHSSFSNEYLWNVCCARIDKRILVFASQFTISLMTLIFTMYKFIFLLWKSILWHKIIFTLLIPSIFV